MDFETLKVETADHVTTVTLNRPDKFNAMNTQMFVDLHQAFAHLAGDPDTRAIVLNGAGPAFSSGLDVSLFQNLTGRTTVEFKQYLEHLQGIFRSMETMEKPIIAAVHGLCLGGGTELVLACDIRFAAEGSSYSLLEMRFGIIPDLGGCKRMARLIGPGHAKELIFTADIIDAARAYEIGLVEHLVPEDQVQEQAMALARRLAEGPFMGIGLAKRVIDRAWDTDSETALQLESLAQTVLINSKDFREAVAAFMEKRKPVYRGE
jgi:enoyl-CoA hydratase/carnithine racemase